MNKTILTSAVVAAFFGLGMDANAETIAGKTAASAPAAHSHLQDAFADYPRKDDYDHTKYQSDTYKDYKADAYVDAKGRAYHTPHWEDKGMDDEVGSPMGLNDRYDNVNTPTVK